LWGIALLAFVLGSCGALARILGVGVPIGIFALGAMPAVAMIVYVSRRPE
jgi:hypothetical protein